MSCALFYGSSGKLTLAICGNPKIKEYDDSCEYNPVKKRAAFKGEEHASADWIVGCDGNWRLCSQCAALPEFKRYRKRVRIER